MFIPTETQDYFSEYLYLLYEELIYDILEKGKRLMAVVFQMSNRYERVATNYALSIIRRRLLKCNYLFSQIAENNNFIFIPLLNEKAIYDLGAGNFEKNEF